jgi:hypothetical protein
MGTVVCKVASTTLAAMAKQLFQTGMGVFSPSRDALVAGYVLRLARRLGMVGLAPAAIAGCVIDCSQA